MYYFEIPDGSVVKPQGHAMSMMRTSLVPWMGRAWFKRILFIRRHDKGSGRVKSYG